VDAVHRAVWGEDATDAVPTPLQRAVQDNGGLVLGGFADIHLAGYAVAFLGWDGAALYQYIHSTAVRPEYQNHHLGFQMHTSLRQEVLQLGLSEVRLAFDPLQSRNAWLFVHRLGGLPDRYLHHYYGQLPDAVNRGIESDRIRLIWSLASPRVERRLEGTYPTPAEDEARWRSATPLIRTEPGESGCDSRSRCRSRVARSPISRSRSTSPWSGSTSRLRSADGVTPRATPSGPPPTCATRSTTLRS